MTILQCDCGNEIYIMDETGASAWQCEECGQWYDYFGCKVGPPQDKPPARPELLVNWSAGEEL